MNTPKFDLGRIVMTAGIAEKVESDRNFKLFVIDSLESYKWCDWGDTCKDDKKLNDDALKNGDRILAVYIQPKTDTKIWIITEWDRSVTTILFPDEY